MRTNQVRSQSIHDFVLLSIIHVCVHFFFCWTVMHACVHICANLGVFKCATSCWSSFSTLSYIWMWHICFLTRVDVIFFFSAKNLFDKRARPIVLQSPDYTDQLTKRKKHKPNKWALGPIEGDVGRIPSFRTAASPPPRPPPENHPPIHQATPEFFYSTSSSPWSPTSRMRLNQRESIETSRSHPPSFNTNTKKRASRKHQPLPPESFNRPPTRSHPPQPNQDHITKNQPKNNLEKRNQTLEWS